MKGFFVFCYGLLLLISTVVQAGDYPARIAWSDQRLLGTTFNGRLQSLKVQPGDRVKKGKLLVQFENSHLAARLKSHKASLHYQALLLKEAEQEMQRADELFDRTVLSLHDYQVAEIELASARAAYEQVNADLQNTRKLLADSKIIAPSDGLVTGVFFRPGEVVVNNLEAKPVVAIADSNRMVARAWVSADVLNQLNDRQKVQVAVQGHWYPAVVRPLVYGEAAGSGKDLQYSLDVSFSVKTLTNRPRVGEEAVIRLP